MNVEDIRQRHASPYPGLRPFRQDEADLFFGREEQVEAMLAKLETHRFLAVVGSSGCGKSSLVRAGLLPALDEGYLSNAAPPWLKIDLRPGNAPLDRLAEVFLKVQPRPDAATGVVEHAEAMLAATLRRGPLGLIDALREARVPSETSVLVLVDQFEELFRFREQGQGQTSVTEAQRNEAAAFVDLLLQTARSTERTVFVVITMRSDFLGDCDRFFGLPEAVNDGQFLAPRLTRTQLGEVIRRPAQLFGVTIDETLVNHLLNQLGNDPDQLPVLQHALMRMWSQKQPALENEPGTPTLTAEDYTLTGGMDASLSQHADEAYHTLDARGQQIAERMFRCLSEGGRDDRLTRRLATIGEIAGVAEASVAEVIAVAEAFRRQDRCFLMPPAPIPLTSQTTLDISHESLLRLWTRMEEWVRTEVNSRSRYRDLYRRADQHHLGGDLLGRQDLNRFQTWFDQDHPTPAWSARYGGDYDLAAAFLKMSAEAIAADDLRKHRAVNAKRYGTVAALCVLGVFTTILFVLWSKASRSASVAEQAKQQAIASDWNGRLLYANSESERGRYARSAALHMSLYDQLPSDDPRRTALLKFIGSECARLGTCLIHDGPLSVAHFSPDGKSVLTVAQDVGEARTWDAATGNPISTPMRHDEVLQDAVFSPDGTLVATAGNDQTARVWESRTGKEVFSLLHAQNVFRVAFSATGTQVATAGEDNILRLWSSQTGLPSGTTVSHDGRIWKIVAQPNGHLLATACSDGKVRLIDVSSPVHTTEVLHHGSSTAIIAFSRDGQLLAVGCADGTVRLWDVITKRLRWSVPVKHNAMAASITFSSDGKLIATGSNDTTARVWDAETGDPVGEMLKHGGAVRDVIFLEDNECLLTGSLDNTIRLWDYRKGRQLSTPLRHEGPVNKLIASPDHDMILSASGDSTARIWKRDGQLQDQDFIPCRDIVRTAEFSPSGRLLITGLNDKSAILWGASQWQVQHEFPHEELVDRVAFGHDDQTVVTGSRDQRLHVWKVRSQPDHFGEYTVSSNVFSLAISQNRTMAVIGTGDGNVYKLSLNPPGLEPDKLEKRHFGWVIGAAFSPRDKLFVTSGTDKCICFWDSDLFEPIGDPIQVASGIWSVAFSRDGRFLVAGCDDGMIRWFDINSRKEIAKVIGHEGRVFPFCYDSRRDSLVTGSIDRSVRFWDAESHVACGIPLRHDGEVSVVLFTPDGRKMLTAAFDKTLRLWHLPAPAFDDPRHADRLRLSVEVRTGYRVDQDGNIVRLKQDEWLKRRTKLSEQGGPSDAPTWDEYESWVTETGHP